VTLHSRGSASGRGTGRKPKEFEHTFPVDGCDAVPFSIPATRSRTTNRLCDMQAADVSRPARAGLSKTRPPAAARHRPAARAPDSPRTDPGAVEWRVTNCRQSGQGVDIGPAACLLTRREPTKRTARFALGACWPDGACVTMQDRRRFALAVRRGEGFLPRHSGDAKHGTRTSEEASRVCSLLLSHAPAMTA